MKKRTAMPDKELEAAIEEINVAAKNLRLTETLLRAIIYRYCTGKSTQEVLQNARPGRPTLIDPNCASQRDNR